MKDIKKEKNKEWKIERYKQQQTKDKKRNINRTKGQKNVGKRHSGKDERVKERQKDRTKYKKLMKMGIQKDKKDREIDRKKEWRKEVG